MRTSLEARLAEKGVLLADGATGTNFMEMDLEPGYPPDLWNLSQPEKPTKLHQMFVDAGSDIILTNTFGANAPRLKLHDAQDQTYEINKAGAEIAGRVAEAAERPVVVAGSVGPTGELFEPMGDLTPDTCKAFFLEQMRGLKDGGADVIWIETMSAGEEITAACDAAHELGMPFVFTASFDTAGRTMMGIDPAGLGDLAREQVAMPIAYGANCGVGASDLLVSNMAMTEANPGDVVVGKANCGIPVIRGKNTVYTGTPETMAEFVRLSVDAGVRIIGGCCGTSPGHIAAMREALDSHTAEARPSMEDVIKRVGPMVAPPPSKEKVAEARNARRRSRRR